MVGSRCAGRQPCQPRLSGCCSESAPYEVVAPGEGTIRLRRKTERRGLLGAGLRPGLPGSQAGPRAAASSVDWFGQRPLSKNDSKMGSMCVHGGWERVLPRTVRDFRWRTEGRRTATRMEMTPRRGFRRRAERRWAADGRDPCTELRGVLPSRGCGAGSCVPSVSDRQTDSVTRGPPVPLAFGPALRVTAYRREHAEPWGVCGLRRLLADVQARRHCSRLLDRFLRPSRTSQDRAVARV